MHAHRHDYCCPSWPVEKLLKAVGKPPQSVSPLVRSRHLFGLPWEWSRLSTLSATWVGCLAPLPTLADIVYTHTHIKYVCIFVNVTGENAIFFILNCTSLFSPEVQLFVDYLFYFFMSSLFLMLGEQVFSLFSIPTAISNVIALFW